LLLPAKYNPSKEYDFKGVVLRYEDNGDTVNNIVVLKLPSTGKSSIEAYGSSGALLQELSNFGLFGKQAYTGVLLGMCIVVSEW
jgi:photosystem II oxygen-evolving enhancer protein 2